MEERLVNLDGRVNEHTLMFTMFDKRFDMFEKRFDGLDQRVDRLEQRVDRLEQRVDARFDSVDRRFDVLDKKLSHQFALTMSLLVTVIAAFIGTIATVVVT